MRSSTATTAKPSTDAGDDAGVVAVAFAEVVGAALGDGASLPRGATTLPQPARPASKNNVAKARRAVMVVG
jgi:hypothetical protein